MSASPTMYASRSRRFYAFLFDYALIAGVCWGLGHALEDVLSALGAYGRLIGAALGVGYFGVLDSRIGRGQTLGKRLLGIRVVGARGEALSVIRAGARATLVLLPLLVSGLSWPGTPPWPIVGAYGLMVAGLPIGLLYLFVFNAPTRQSLHDLCARAFTVTDGVTAPAQPSRPRLVHGAVAATLLLTTGGAYVTAGVAAGESAPFREMRAMRVMLTQHPNVEAISLSREVTLEKPREATLHIEARVTGPTEGRGRQAHELLSAVVAKHPKVAEYESVVLVFRHGWDLGFARGGEATRYPMDFVESPTG